MSEFDSFSYEEFSFPPPDPTPTVESDPVGELALPVEDAPEVGLVPLVGDAPAVEVAPPPGVAPPSETVAVAPVKRKRLPLIFWGLVGLLVLLVVGGIASVGYYLLLTQAPASTSQTPWDDLQPENIAAGVAVWSLANTTPDQIYRQAMTAEAIETATAEALTTTSLAESERLGWLTVLARRQALAGDIEQALALYQLAADLAILKPNLGDRARASTLLAAAEGFVALADPARAETMLDQVILIGQHSTEVNTAVGRQLADQVAAVFESMGDLDKARAARAATTSGTGQSSPSYPDPIAIIEAEEALVYPPRVLKAETARQNEAQIFAENWINRGGEASQSQTLALENALIDEDLVRSAYYASLASDPAQTPAALARVQWDRIRWLVIKHRAASGLYGLDLVPNWTAEQPAIRQTLQDGFIGLNEMVLPWIDTLPVEQQQPATYNMYRDALMWARIGLYPDADQVFLANAMNDALTQWGTASGLQPVARIGDDGKLVIELQWLGG